CIVTLDPHHISCEEAYLKEWEDILPRLHVFFPSELEFKLLSGTRKPTDHLEVIVKFAEFYKVEVLVLKAAENGAYLYLRDTKALYHIPTAAREVIDCTGAGDAFAGGFNYSYFHDLDPIKALRYASISASFAMESYAAMDLFYKYKQDAIQRLNGFGSKIERIYL
ncbi:MAG: PfkB family carbohydrate kinase, partial [Oscillospiraceae bacterium]|nr:PfkB family carbohydrate kinase [Oscillospiraceae bacterium]